MAAVGLSDVFRYGTRFLAHLLVVVLAGVVFVLIGNEVGDFLVGTLSSPGLRSSLGTTAYAGIAISALGVLVTVAGLGGLLFKLVADGTAVGTRSVLAEANGFDDSSEEAEPNDERTTAESAGDATASEPRATDSEPSGDQSRSPQQPDETPAPAPEESVNPFSQEQPAASQEPVTQEPVSQQERATETATESFDQPVGQRSTASGESDRTSQTGPAQDSQSPQSERETAGRPSETDESVTGEDGSDEQSNPDEPPEWTPPDPDEFERQQSRKAAERAQQDSEDIGGQSPTDTGAVDQSSQGTSASSADEQRRDEFEDDTRLVDEDQFDGSDSNATTWDDLQSPTESTNDPVTEGSQQATEDWGSPEQFDDQPTERVDEETQSEDVADDNGYEDQDTSEDDNSGFSFQAGGDGDPLSDALDDE